MALGVLSKLESSVVAALTSSSSHQTHGPGLYRVYSGQPRHHSRDRPSTRVRCPTASCKAQLVSLPDGFRTVPV
jgi:hypothetical protein